MYQVNFSNQSITELNKLETSIQLGMIDTLSCLSPDKLQHGDEDLGIFNRDGKIYYRLRSGDFRIYFEVKDNETLYAHYILHQHTLTDFIFRFKLPISEEQMAEQHDSFWKYLETLKW